MSRTLWLAVGALIASSGCQAVRDEAPSELVERCRELEQRALEGNGAIEILRSLVEAAPSRLAGSPGMRAAEQWAMARMREIGFDEVRAEPCMVPNWQRGVETAATVQPTSVPLRVTALGGSVATPKGGVEAEVVEVRTFEQLRAMGAAAAGKIVFFNRPMPRALRRTGSAYGSAVPQRSNGAIETAKVGGLAAIVRSMTTTGAMKTSPK